MAVVGDVLGLAVVGAEGDPRGAELLHEREQRTEISRAGGLADQEPEPRPEPLPPLLDRAGLVVGADSGRRIGVQLLAAEARRVTVDVLRPVETELRQLALVAGDDAGEVHHLGQPEHPPPAEETLQVALVQRPSRRLERRGRDAGRGHEVDVERQVVAGVEQPVHAVGSQHVRDFVRIGDDRRRAERQHEPCELVDEQLRRLEVHVRVDETRHDPASGGVELLRALVVAQPRDVVVRDRHVHLEPLAREDREDTAAANDEIRRLVPASYCEAPRKVGHTDLTYYPWRRGGPDSALAGRGAAPQVRAPRGPSDCGWHGRHGRV